MVQTSKTKYQVHLQSGETLNCKLIRWSDEENMIAQVQICDKSVSYTYTIDAHFSCGQFYALHF